MEGWIKLHRKSFDNFLYKENRPLTRREAWEDILLRVNYIEGESLFGNEKIICKRGQSIKSLDTWAKIFNWDKSKVKRFFDLLQKNSMIVVENLHKTTRITVCKYEDYQGDQNGNETHLKRKRNADETEMKPIKEYKEEKEINNKLDFIIFWDTYNKKVGDKTKCQKIWDKLSLDTQKQIIDSLPLFISQSSDKQFQPHPLTYLNQKRWNDEIIKKDSTSKPLSIFA